jgi:hypothetical protein
MDITALVMLVEAMEVMDTAVVEGTVAEAMVQNEIWTACSSAGQTSIIFHLSRRISMWNIQMSLLAALRPQQNTGGLARSTLMALVSPTLWQHLRRHPFQV